MDMPEVEVQVVDISTYHRVERHTATLIVNPIVVELGLVNRTDDMANMLVVQFKQHHELLPILVLIVLKVNPQVVVLGIVGEYEHAHLGVWHRVTATWGILKAHHALVVV